MRRHSIARFLALVPPRERCHIGDRRVWGDLGGSPGENRGRRSGRTSLSRPFSAREAPIKRRPKRATKTAGRHSTQEFFSSGGQLLDAASNWGTIVQIAACPANDFSVSVRVAPSVIPHARSRMVNFTVYGCAAYHSLPSPVTETVRPPVM